MLIFNKKKRIQYLGFNDFWFSLIGILILSFITDYLFSKSFIRLPFSIAIWSWSVSLFYTVCDWIILRSVLIFLRKKFPNFKDDTKRIILFISSIIIVVTLVDYLGGKFIKFFFSLLGDNINHTTQLRILLPVTIITTMTMAIYEAIYYYIRLKKSIREEEQTKQIIIQAQLDALRNQAQPHFLFNSLNTLRDIIDQDPKENAKTFVDNLSNVYRFIIESGNSNLISLEKEVKFVKAYIHIQKERFGDNLKVYWNIPTQNLHQLIVPMSLQLLTENAIKHNIVSKSKPLEIYIALTDNKISVSNNIQLKSTKLSSTKIGLKNIEKRYSLITNIPVQIEKDNNCFRVFLPLLKTSDLKC
ncbi:histidine kinase [Tenacibaculum sp. SZ-18]|uniref:sensor histidine kinase n=1 Tax=Tenacibaculum sp. SZ-18 TaxID=754423 RepID=UPI000C2CEB90|nr:histidine kinase [Tenacibaculum sp. SZ-18]AUC14964.1 histidine kinase [Tenacibaculum sp. SZ-18]